MSVIEITSKPQFDALLSEKKHVALQAHAVWCGPCKAMSPIFEKHARTHSSDSVVFAKFDFDEIPDLAQELGIRSIPAFFFFEGGEPGDKLVGANPAGLQKIVNGIAEKAKAEGGELKTDEDF